MTMISQHYVILDFLLEVNVHLLINKIENGRIEIWIMQVQKYMIIYIINKRNKKDVLMNKKMISMHLARAYLYAYLSNIQKLKIKIFVQVLYIKK